MVKILQGCIILHLYTYIYLVNKFNKVEYKNSIPNTSAVSFYIVIIVLNNIYLCFSARTLLRINIMLISFCRPHFQTGLLRAWIIFGRSQMGHRGVSLEKISSESPDRRATNINRYTYGSSYTEVAGLLSRYISLYVTDNEICKRLIDSRFIPERI